MKKIIISIVAAVVVIGAIALIIGYSKLDVLVKGGVETVGPRVTKVDVKLDSAHVSPFSGKGQLNGIFIGNPEGFKTPSAIKIGVSRMALKAKSIMSGVVEIDEIYLESPEITLDGSLTGNNISKILANIEASVGGGSKDASSSEKKFCVKDILIKDGKINLHLNVGLDRSLTVPLPEIHLQNVGSKENGVTAAELSKQMLSQVLSHATQAASAAIAAVGKQVKEIGKGATEQATKVGEKATKDIKSLFKK